MAALSDVWTTARLLVERYGADATAVAESEAIDGLLCGDAAESATWERVIAAVETLLERPPLALIDLAATRYRPELTFH